VSRSLQAQIGEFLEAARRLGRGDFTAQVPTQGRDEFAALGGEFNRMARLLESRLEDLRTERLRLENAMRRLGEAFASNLDRSALLEIAVRTAVDGVDADGGRAMLAADGAEAARFGELDGLDAVVGQVESESTAAIEPREATADGASALAHPLRAAAGGEVLGVVSVWRRGGPFSDAERELFHYLAAQAAVSLDNVALHETVQRQAVTDELTSLYNHRRFHEGLRAEVERSRRFEQGLGLVMLDIDNFKQVNDTYGHQVGDRVLAEVARILRDNSREIDEPARYGGEELAVVLPGTDLEGAYNLAERVRTGIERLDLPLDDGRVLHVTASFGAASMPESANDQSSLIAAADTALYVAKRSGKNRTARAEPERARPSQ
jgi:diguanylate cyclase (GGDEF)-like protein